MRRMIVLPTPQYCRVRCPVAYDAAKITVTRLLDGNSEGAESAVSAEQHDEGCRYR
jgi:hypothetical protein